MMGKGGFSKWAVAFSIVIATFVLVVVEGSDEKSRANFPGIQSVAADRSVGDRSVGDRGLTDIRPICGDWVKIRENLDPGALNRLVEKEKLSLFNCYDENDDGKYSLTEFLNLFRLISGGGRPTNPENRKNLFKSLDTKKDDLLSFDEFKHFDIIF